MNRRFRNAAGNLLAAAGLCAAGAFAQSAPILSSLTPPNIVLPPAVSDTGHTIVFPSTLMPNGHTDSAVNLYAWFASDGAVKQLTFIAPPVDQPFYLANGVRAASITPDGAFAAYTLNATGEDVEVHVINTATGADMTAAVDKGGCIQPAVFCPVCMFTCVNSPHITPDGKRVLYAASRQQPFYVAGLDGSSPKQLPINAGTLAPGPQRVITIDGRFLFSSNAPFGPTFAPSATDVYWANLDGTNVQQVTKFGNNPIVYAMNATTSTDGSLIAFESNFAVNDRGWQESRQIFLINGDGSNLRGMTNEPNGAGNPTLSPDGKFLAYDANGQVVVIRTDIGATVLRKSALLSYLQNPVISGPASTVTYCAGPTVSERAAIYQQALADASVTTVFAPHGFNPNGIASAAAAADPAVGGLITVWGRNLQPEDKVMNATTSPLPTSVNGISVLANGTKIPILATTPWQVNAQLPQGMAAGNANFQLVFDDDTKSEPHTAEVHAVAPSLFSIPQSSPNLGTYNLTAALHAGTANLVDIEHPATAGDAIELYGTGCGITDPGIPDGYPSLTQPLAIPRIRPQVTIGNQPAKLLSIALSPGLVGVCQINVEVPRAQPGLQPVMVTTPDAQQFAATTFIAIK